MPTPKTYDINVHVLMIQEDDCLVVYCPALDLSSYGQTEDEAKNAFEEALEIFIEETERKGTLEKVLLDLGWTLRQKPSFQYQPPEFPLEESFALLKKAVKVFEETMPIPYNFPPRPATYANPN